MSLTRMLREVPALADRLTALVPDDTAVRLQMAGFAEELPLSLWSEFAVNLPMPARPLTDHYALVGTAFDYLMRFEIGRCNPRSIEEEWIADQALKLMRSLIELDEFDLLPVKTVGVSGKPRELTAAICEAYEHAHDVARMAIEDFRSIEGPWAGPRLNEDDRKKIVDAALIMAKMDTFYRTATIDDLLTRHVEGDVYDLLQLMGIAPLEVLGSGDSKEIPWLNPSFGSISKMFNGADADLVVGNVLVDFKTTVHLDLVKHFPQLVGYRMIMNRFHETENTKFPEIGSVGIYFCRHGLLATIDAGPITAQADYGPTRDVLFLTAESRHTEGVGFV